MTKDEKIKQKEAKAAMKRRFEVDRKIARELALEETVTFHAKSIEKIFRKEMPKGINLNVRMELSAPDGHVFSSCECGSVNGKMGTQIEVVTTAILDALLDKYNMNYIIEHHSEC